MKTFDDIEVRRPGLAQSHLALLGAQAGRPLALFAARRVGKTFFLDHDLAHRGEEGGDAVFTGIATPISDRHILQSLIAKLV